jgi:subtilisin
MTIRRHAERRVDDSTPSISGRDDASKGICMTAAIQEQLKATGRVQVIVVLKPPVSAARLGGALESVSIPGPLLPTDAEKQRVRKTAQELERLFVTGTETREGALALAVAHDARRRGGRVESSALESVGFQIPPSPPVMVFDNLGIILGTTDRAGVRALSADSRVLAVTAAPELSLIRPELRRVTQARGGISWGLRRLGIPTLWDQGLTGRGILVGHLDTGVDANHPALKGTIAEFAEFDWLGQPVTKPRAHDPDGHGTHTAGTVVGRKVATRQFGVAPEAQLASALVIEGGNMIARVLSGLNWLIGLKVRVISISLGLRGYLSDFLPVVRILRERQVLPVGAVGNAGPGASCSPGNYADVLSVGACDQADGVPLFSSSQRFRRRRDPDVPNLVAPGFEVFSCVPGRRYAEYSGTSMATPHVAGLAALLFGAHPEATAVQVERAILDSCTLPPGMLRERGNLGIPDGPDALAKLRTALGLSEPLTITERVNLKRGR